MPVLYYWDVGSSQYLPCAQGPQGQPGPAGGYGPPTTFPPPTGFNSTLDGAGNQWVSMNGSAWAQATNVLFAQYTRTAAFTTVTPFAAFLMDTSLSDVYGLYNSATGIITFPVAGLWEVYYQMTCSAAATGQNYQSQILDYTASGAISNGMCTGSGAMYMTPNTQIIRKWAAGYQLQTRHQSTPTGLTGQPGQQWCRLDIKYVGTG